MIPNYINSPTNCVASTSFYSVCCIDECEGLLGHLEEHMGKPSASPSEIVSLIADLSSSTVPSNRTLPAWLLQRLDEVASHHGGQVPLHGRLFAQWMHYAYPRECSYPRALGETNMERFGERITKQDMMQVISGSTSSRQSIDASFSAEQKVQIHSAMWKMEEELVVHPPGGAFVSSSESPIRDGLRGVMMLLALFSVSVTGLRSLQTSAKSSVFTAHSEKYYV